MKLLGRFSSVIYLSCVVSKAVFSITPNPDLISQQYLVHMSEIMSENSTKIAGGMLINPVVNENEATFKKVGIQAKGTNIRGRVTLHHCYGGCVPANQHGAVIHTLLGEIKPVTTLYTNPDMCAYLDPLSAFEGEIIGGLPTDFMTIDCHVYGSQSLVFLPHSKRTEFDQKNPNYQGTVIEFDPAERALSNVVNCFINEKALPTHKDLVHANGFMPTKPTKDFFAAKGWVIAPHGATLFSAVEKLLHPFIAAIRAGHNPKVSERIKLCPVDQLDSRLALINALFTQIYRETTSLSDHKRQFIVQWQNETFNWLNLAVCDADLRQKQGKSLFINNPGFQKFIDSRRSQRDLDKLAESLVPQDTQLWLTSLTLFPELQGHYDIFSFVGTDQDKPFDMFRTNLKLSQLTKLCEGWADAGYSDHAYGLLYVRLLNDVLTSQFPQLYTGKLNAVSLKVNFSKRLTPHILKLIEDYVMADETYHNEKSLVFLNSDAGKIIRDKIFGWSDDLTFQDLLRLMPSTRILYEDMEVLMDPKQNEIYAACKYFTPPTLREVCLISIVRDFLIKMADKGEDQDEGHAEINKPTCVNVASAAWTMGSKLSDIRMFLPSIPLVSGVPKCLTYFFEKGCFASMADLISTCVSVEGKYAQEEINYLVQNSCYPTFESFVEKVAGYQKARAEGAKEVDKLIQTELDQAREMYQRALSPDMTFEDAMDLLSYYNDPVETTYSHFCEKSSYSHYRDTEFTKRPRDSAMAWFVYRRAMGMLAESKENTALAEMLLNDKMFWTESSALTKIGRG